MVNDALKATDSLGPTENGNDLAVTIVPEPQSSLCSLLPAPSLVAGFAGDGCKPAK